jgi:hypothetical protein
MRHILAVALALASGVVGCCYLGRGPGGAPASDARGATEAATAGHAVVLDVALIERPAGDGFLDRELWDLGNEQGVDLELKPALEENGLRVAQVGGMLPARLQALLKSPRSCPDPRRLRAEPDAPTPVQVGPPRKALAFEVHERGGARPLDLTDATCFFEVTPALEGEDGLRLRFRPRIRHGKARIETHVASDPGGPLRLAVEAREPVEEFPHLCWELTLVPDEYVLVGARRDRPGTIGSAYFTTAGRLKQHLLVLRASRLGSHGVDESMGQSPPLAMQAAWTARGTGR